MESSTTPAAPISNVAILSTGTAEQHREHRYGSRLPKTLWALFSRSWVTVPINVFLIEHQKGLILFDTGLDPAIVSDPKYVSMEIGRFFLRRVFRFHIGPEDTLARKLREAGYRADKISKAIISHLHFDHIGCIADVPQAELLVSRTEWHRLSEPHPEMDWLLREHIELPDTDWCPVDFTHTDDPLLAPFGGAHDLMGDQSMMLLPTPGHTDGSMSLLVRSDGMAPLLMIGDLAYGADLLLRDQIPGVGDQATLRATYAKVRELKKQLPDLTILATHDPAAKEALAAALENTLMSVA